MYLVSLKVLVIGESGGTCTCISHVINVNPVHWGSTVTN